MTSRGTTLFVAMAGVATLVVSSWPADAQSLTRPPRVSRPQQPTQQRRTGGPPLDPNRSRQELTAMLDLLGGYDDDLNGLTTGRRQVSQAQLAANQDVFSGIGSASAQYMIGKPDRSLAVDGRAFGSSYGRVVNDVLYGGDLSASGQTSLGRRFKLSATESYRNDPFLNFGQYAGLPPGTTNNPAVNPTFGLQTNRSWTTDTGASMRQEWTRRTNTTVSYNHQQKTFPGGSNFNTTADIAQVAIDRSIMRTAGLQADYRFATRDYTQVTGSARKMETHSITGGFRAEIVRSRTRSVGINAGGGATYTDGFNAVVNQQYAAWTPSGHASIAADLGRSWNVAGTVSRTVTVLQGIVPINHITEAGNVSGGGQFTQRIESVFTFGFSRSHSPNAPTSGLPNATFKNYTTSAQLRFALSDRWSALAIYSYYRHKLDSPSLVIYGINAEQHRNSIRVGLGYRLPIIGS